MEGQPIQRNTKSNLPLMLLSLELVKTVKLLSLFIEDDPIIPDES
jgi:hypothetical protein